ncbi:MAG TPA: TonB-dependent receptor [Terracidiphilus sp.]|nr:TonB-dependent receptor [Terracidiphilus sp.]
MKKSLLGWILLCILSTVTPSFGQTASTSLRGTIKDPTGALVPGAKITIVDKSNGATLSVVADSTGDYSFPQIPPARYTIVVSATGFGNQSKIAELLVNQPATINFTLTIEASTVTIDVTASAQTLNTSDATIGNAVGNETIQAMPMDGRDPISLLSLQPGALYLGETTTLMDKTAPGNLDSRQGAVSGARSDQGNVTLDGVDDNDQINGYAFNGVLRSTLDSTEEFRVTTSNGNADAGRTSGAQVSLVTKSGTNHLHGSLYEYNRPSNTVANDWFIKNQELSATPAQPNRPTKYIVNTFGGSVGGPILKDKLFFFFNYEGQRLATNETVSTTTPSASFLAGQLGYTDVNGNVQMLTSQQIAQLDANCTQCKAPGVDAAMLQYLSTEPAASGSGLAAGDGINFGSYNFSSRAPSTLNTNIGKIDYNLNKSNHIFARGNLQKDTASGAQNFPGQPASSSLEDNTKGMAFGHTWTPTSNIVNDVRYGYIRQGYSSAGIGQGDYVVVRFLTQPTAQTRSSIVSVPVDTIDDTLSWTKGSHTLSFGGNWRMVQSNSANNTGSFNGATTNPSYLSAKGKPDPTTLGLPAIGQNETAFDQMYATIIGDVAERNASANYVVTSPTSASLLADGASVSRHFKANEFEYFLQDAWRLKQNLTVTFGLRHTLLQTPYETKGQEIAPTVDTHNWYLQRGAAAAKGQVYEPDLFFTPVGKVNHAPAYWAKQKSNIAPRLAIVYSPDSKTSIRAGYGIYYDHYGEALTSRFSRLGSFGLSSQFSSAANTVNFNTAPRFTGPHDLPNLPVPPAPTTQTYPYAVPDGTFGINWGIDNRVKTPYVQAFNLSVQRELPGGFLLDAAYVGRIGRHLFQQLDLAEPVNYNDPKGAGDYFTAGTLMSKMTDQLGGSCKYCDGKFQHLPTIPYFEDVFPQMQSLDFNGESATDAIYNDEWAPQRYTYGETGALYDIDFGCFYGCPNGTLFWDQQFSSLIALASVGNSYYNAGQFTLRRPSQKGLTLDFSYTFSRSIDMGSDAERSATSYGAIQNVWSPKLSRGVSDFDAQHLITADWVYALPFGTGKALLGNSGKLGNAIWGDWQWAGLGRWSSGLPFSVIEPGWTTNWELQAYAVTTAPVKTHKHMEGGLPQVFADDQAIQGGVMTGSPMRLPYPGEAGQRNNFRSDGVFGIDSTMSKSWGLGERAKMKFAWEVYNVTNSVRFDAGSYNNSTFANALTYGGFGFYGGTLGTHIFRRMQFGLRLDF